MLHGSAFSGCETFTLSTYCFEHDQLIRSELEAERAQLAPGDAPPSRELAEAAQTLA